MTKKSYKETKNYLHNELGLSKPEVEKMLTDYVDKKMGKSIVDIMDSKWMSRRILDKVGEVISGYKYKDDPVSDYIKKVIQDEVKKAVIERIKFNEITVQ
jgi:hypothetical protein